VKTLLKGANWPPFVHTIISSQKLTYVTYMGASLRLVHVTCIWV